MIPPLDGLGGKSQVLDDTGNARSILSMNLLKSRIVAGVIALVAVYGRSAAAQPQVIFDNTPNLINQAPAFFLAQEYGDELLLAGSARQVNQFQFAYHGDFGATTKASYVLRFYANDGTDSIAGAGVALRPKSLLWESSPLELFNGVNQVTLDIPDVVVPDGFTWTISFSGIDGTPGKRAALMLANPAVIGALLAGTPAMPELLGSYDDFWTRVIPADPESWSLYSFGFAPTDPKGNFFAKVTAVPYRPELQISRATGQVTLRWPTAATGFVLERNENLAAGAGWLAVATPPSVAAGFNHLTQPIESGNVLYRLRHP